MHSWDIQSEEYWHDNEYRRAQILQLQRCVLQERKKIIEIGLCDVGLTVSINLKSLNSGSEEKRDPQLLQQNCSVAENRLLGYIRDNTLQIIHCTIMMDDVEVRTTQHEVLQTGWQS